MSESFDLAVDKERGEFEIGKNNIGLKLSPLSKAITYTLIPSVNRMKNCSEASMTMI